ncbi:MAG: alpha/beta hydrolase [Polyangiaceae bacterium]
MRQRAFDALGVGKSHLVGRALDHAVHAFARVRYRMKDARPETHDVDVVEDLVYGPTPDRHHRLDVYVPRSGDRPMPVVMYVHGGGFAMLSKETHRVMALALAKRGYVVFNINYRLGTKNLFPAPLEDAAKALLWVRDNAPRFHGDPSRIALAGESAGGNLVTALAVATVDRRPEPFARDLFDAKIALRGVVATYGYLDLSDVDRLVANPKLPRWTKHLLVDAARSYLGARPGEKAKGLPLASPLVLLEELADARADGGRPGRAVPPFFVSCGTRDPLLPHSKRLKAALDRLGAPCELLVAPGEIHGYDAMVWRPHARTKWQRTHAFLGRTMASADNGGAKP